MARDSFDLGVFDILMPGMTGEELAVRTKEIDPRMKLVAMSALQCGPEVMEAGFDIALEKPFDIQRLVRICRQIPDT